MDGDSSQWGDALRDMARQAQLHPILDAAESLFGARLTDAFFDGPDMVRLSVLDLDKDDRAAVVATARRLEIDPSAVHIERTDPALLQAWERLRHEVDELSLLRPRILLGGTVMRQRFCHPPFRILLTADAESTAERLHRSYGHFVNLTVGALAYPPGVRPRRSPRERETATKADPHELWAEFDGPLSITRGQTAVHHLDVVNRSGRSLAVHTNGHITAGIVDLVTGETVGGFAGMQNLPLVIFTAAAAETVRVPLLVGTASFRPELGYMVPTGTWGLLAPMDLGDGRRVVGEPMHVTITD